MFIRMITNNNNSSIIIAVTRDALTRVFVIDRISGMRRRYSLVSVHVIDFAKIPKDTGQITLKNFFYQNAVNNLSA